MATTKPSRFPRTDTFKKGAKPDRWFIGFRWDFDQPMEPHQVPGMVHGYEIDSRAIVAWNATGKVVVTDPRKRPDKKRIAESLRRIARGIETRKVRIVSP